MGKPKVKSVDSSNASLVYIRSLYSSFTKAERKVADAVMGHSGEVAYDSITDLAERAEVGETSVLRFCRHLGYRGFQDFKVAMVRETAKVGDAAPDYAGDSSSSIYKQITDRSVRLLNETFSLLEEGDLDRSVEILLGARNIVFFGAGSSGVTAEQAKYRFLRLGWSVEAISDVHLAPVRATTLGEGDVAVVVTVSGSTIDTVETARVAHECGATIICITSHARSPVTKFADIVLLSASQEGPMEGSSLSAQLVQLHVLDLLFESLLVHLGDRGAEMLKKTAQSVSEKLY